MDNNISFSSTTLSRLHSPPSSPSKLLTPKIGGASSSREMGILIEVQNTLSQMQTPQKKRKFVCIQDEMPSSVMAKHQKTLPKPGLFPPPTPVKKGRMPLIVPPHVATLASAQNSTLKINEMNASFSNPIRGTYVIAFSISSEHELVKNIKNENLLVKVFNEKHARFTDKVNDYMKSSIENYKEGLALKLPCAKIYNVDTALKDQYYLVEYIPYKINLENAEHRNQIRKFFEISFQKQLTCDLSYSNLRVKEDGTVTLIDFAEKKLDFNNEKFGFFVIQFLKSWVKQVQEAKEGREAALDLIAEFTTGLGFAEHWITEALAEYYPKVPFFQ